MALKLPSGFKNDIQGRDTTLVPVVIIGNVNIYNPDTTNQTEFWSKVAIISTNSLTNLCTWDGRQADDTGLGIWDCDTDNYSGGYVPADALPCKPILLNIPSLRESVDIENRNYKINSVSIDISNLPLEGQRFSDFIQESPEPSLSNVECRVFWVAPSTTHIYPMDINAPSDTDNLKFAFMSYAGIIRRYDYNDEKIKLVLEDRSQVIFHKDLPVANLGTGLSVPERYKNKPIPIVYGHVDRSPCVFKVETNPDIPEYSALKNILADAKPVVGFIDEPATLYQYGDLDIRGGLFVGSSSLGYAPCARIFPHSLTTELFYFDLPFVDDSNQNYEYDAQGAMIKLLDDATNDVKAGFLRGIIGRFPSDVKINSNAYGGVPHPEGNSSGFIAIKNHSTTQYTAGGTTTEVNASDNWLADEIISNTSETLLRIINDNIDQGCHLRGSVIGSTPLDGGIGDEYMAAKIELTPSGCGFEADSYFIGAFFHHHEYLTEVDTYNQWENIAVKTWIHDYVMHGSEIANNGETWFSNTNLGSINQPNPFTVKVNGSSSAVPSSIIDFSIGAPKYTISETSGGAADAQVHIDLWSANIFHVTYVDKLASRDFYANVIGRRYYDTAETATSFQQIIGDILNTELGEPLPAMAASEYAGWEYAFTIKDKINSKKLIEDFARSSPYITYFDFNGKFKIAEIPQNGGILSNLDGNETIKDADVIDFSFMRTKIEDVYTKIELKYKWDYARREFSNSIDVNVDDIYGGAYKHGYYNFPSDDSESTLVIDDDRGKFIRDEETALKFARWHLFWKCNQHLKIRLKLPLKYMNLEIGDIVKFDKILGDIYPYGINYLAATSPNAQPYLSHFLVMYTNKTLRHCDIEVIQLHNCSECTTTDDKDKNGGYDCAGICDGAHIWDACGNCVLPEDASESEDCDCPEIGDTGMFGCNPESGCHLVWDCNGDCSYPPGSAPQWDTCGVCGGDGSTCNGCIDPEALNYLEVDGEPAPCCDDMLCLTPMILSSPCCETSGDSNNCDEMLAEAGWDPNNIFYQDPSYAPLIVNRSDYNSWEDALNAARLAWENAGGMYMYEHYTAPSATEDEYAEGMGFTHEQWLAGNPTDDQSAWGSNRPIIYTSDQTICYGFGVGVTYMKGKMEIFDDDNFIRSSSGSKNLTYKGESLNNLDHHYIPAYLHSTTSPDIFTKIELDYTCCPEGMWLHEFNTCQSGYAVDCDFSSGEQNLRRKVKISWCYYWDSPGCEEPYVIGEWDYAGGDVDNVLHDRWLFIEDIKWYEYALQLTVAWEQGWNPKFLVEIDTLDENDNPTDQLAFGGSFKFYVTLDLYNCYVMGDIMGVGSIDHPDNWAKWYEILELSDVPGTHISLPGACAADMDCGGHAFPNENPTENDFYYWQMCAELDSYGEGDEYYYHCLEMMQTYGLCEGEPVFPGEITPYVKDKEEL